MGGLRFWHTKRGPCLLWRQPGWDRGIRAFLWGAAASRVQETLRLRFDHLHTRATSCRQTKGSCLNHDQGPSSIWTFQPGLQYWRYSISHWQMEWEGCCYYRRTGSWFFLQNRWCGRNYRGPNFDTGSSQTIWHHCRNHRPYRFCLFHIFCLVHIRGFYKAHWKSCRGRRRHRGRAPWYQGRSKKWWWARGHGSCH